MQTTVLERLPAQHEDLIVIFTSHSCHTVRLPQRVCAPVPCSAVPLSWILNLVLSLRSMTCSSTITASSLQARVPTVA